MSSHSSDRERGEPGSSCCIQVSSKSSVRKRKPTECLLRKKIPYDITPEYGTILQKSPMQSKTDLYFVDTSCSYCGGPLAKSVSRLILFAESMLCRDGILRMNNYLIHQRVKYHFPSLLCVMDVENRETCFRRWRC